MLPKGLSKAKGLPKADSEALRRMGSSEPAEAGFGAKAGEH